MFFVVTVGFADHPENPVCFRMIGVKACQVPDQEKQNQAAGYTQCESGNVDEGCRPLPGKVSDRCDQVVLEHAYGVFRPTFQDGCHFFESAFLKFLGSFVAGPDTESVRLRSIADALRMASRAK